MLLQQLPEVQVSHCVVDRAGAGEQVTGSAVGGGCSHEMVRLHWQGVAGARAPGLGQHKKQGVLPPLSAGSGCHGEVLCGAVSLDDFSMVSGAVCAFMPWL
jgi:hypothetical protein